MQLLRNSAARYLPQWAVLAVCVLLAAYFALCMWIVPEPLYSSKYDPEMAYMLNSLGIFEGKPYDYIDHPGTPFELAGTLFLAPTRLITRSVGEFFIDYHLRHPGLFLGIGRSLLFLGSLAVVWLLGTRLLPGGGLTGAVVSAALAASFYAVSSGYGFKSLAFWSHNSVNLPLGGLLLFLVWREVWEQDETQAGRLALFGLAAGVLAAIQMYFATWVIGLAGVFALRSWLKRRRVFPAIGSVAVLGLSAAAGFFVATLPILHRYRDLYYWIRSIALHQGKYGGGPEGVTSLDRVGQNLASLWSDSGLTFLALAGVILLLGYAALRTRLATPPRPAWWSLTFGLGLQAAVTLALILKHPSPYYLLAIATILPFLLALAFSRLLPAGGYQARVAIGSAVLVLVLLMVSLVRAVSWHLEVVRNIQIEEHDLAAQQQQVALERGVAPEDQIVVWSFGSWSPCAALRFGNVYVSGLFSDDIEQICPRDWYYEVFGGQAVLPSGKVSLGDSQEWDILVVPQDFLPGEAESMGRIVTSQAMTDKRGPIVFLLRGLGNP